MALIAACVIRSAPSYRRECFQSGLARCGYRVVPTASPRPARDEVLVVWNRHGSADEYARRYLAAGATVMVAENGWIGSDPEGHKLYALCRSHHCGAGSWLVGDEDRWDRLRIELKPWRSSGEYLLLLPQRSIGEPGVAMSPSWLPDVQKRLQRLTRRRIVIRPHPGKERTEPDFTGVWASVVWGSGAGIKSIVAGVPVFHELPSWIGGAAAKFGIDEIEAPFLGDRLPMLHRLAHAQWSATEIATGEPFARLLSLAA